MVSTFKFLTHKHISKDLTSTINYLIAATQYRL